MHLSNYNLFSFLLAGMGVGISNLFGALESGFLTLAPAALKGEGNGTASYGGEKAPGGTRCSQGCWREAALRAPRRELAQEPGELEPAGAGGAAGGTVGGQRPRRKAQIGDFCSTPRA